MITKQDAAILFAYSFKLVDKEGKIYSIDGVGIDGITIYSEGEEWHCSLDANQIGTDYWILKRPYSQLTKSILVEGKEIIPIVELAKVEGFFIEDNGYRVHISPIHKLHCLGQGKFRFMFDIKSNFNLYIENTPVVLSNQEQLFHKKYSLHFIDLPEGTYKEIE